MKLMSPGSSQDPWQLGSVGQPDPHTCPGGVHSLLHETLKACDNCPHSGVLSLACQSRHSSTLLTLA